MSQLQAAEAKAELAQVDARTRLRDIEAIEVKSNDDAKRIAELGKSCAEARKAAEQQRKDLVGPLNDTVAKINAMFKPITTAFEEVEALAKKKATEWTEAERKRVADENRRRDEAERKAREAKEAAEREAAKATEAAASANDVDAALEAQDAADRARQEADEAERKRKEALQAPIAQPAASMNKATGGTMKSRPSWGFRITDPTKIPREYCLPSEQLLRGALSAAKTAGLLREDEHGEPVINFAIPGIDITFERKATW